MSWLTTAGDDDSGHDAVLGLLPTSAARLERLLAVAVTVADVELLEVCWLRTMQVLGCRASIATDDPRLAELDGWRTSDVFSGRERVALAYTEQFVIDPNGVRGEHDEGLAGQLSKAGVFDFVSALNVVDGYLRACAFLDVDAIRPKRLLGWEPRVLAADEDLPPPPPPNDGPGLRDYRTSLIDPRITEARTAFTAAVLGLNGLDDVTTEAVRLRNASFQQCHY